MEANLMSQVPIAQQSSMNTVNRPATAPSAESAARNVNNQQSVSSNDQSTVNLIASENLTALDIPLLFEEGDIAEPVLDRYVDSVNQALAPSFFRLNVGVHEATNRFMVQVVDTNTDEVLRELPPESRLDIVARLQEFAGLLFDERS